MKASWQVVVIYETPEARETAVALCERLVERFWSQVSFDVAWWSFDLLSNPEAASEAREKAAAADIVIFAGPSENELPSALRVWNETWLARRGKREGTLVDLVAAAEGRGRPRADQPSYFRQLAHRAGMDYLTQVPQNLLHPVPESPESCTQRAEQVTSLLDEILHQIPPPPPGPAHPDS